VEAGRWGIAKISCYSPESNPGSPARSALLYRLSYPCSITKEAYVRKFVRTHFGSVENIVASRVGIRDSNIRRDSFLSLLLYVTNNEVKFLQSLMNILPRSTKQNFLVTNCMAYGSAFYCAMSDTARQNLFKDLHHKVDENW
jgi:hypothetical protein